MVQAINSSMTSRCQDALREEAAGIVPNTIDHLRCKARMLSEADLGCVSGALAESIIDKLRTLPAAA
jgi:hypothetical protein